MGAPICNTVLQHFSCNMVDAIRTIPQDCRFRLCLIQAGCQLVCFEFRVLHFRLPLYTRNGQVGEHVLLLWFLALVWLAAVVNLFVLNLLCLVSVCLLYTRNAKRADCRTRTYREATKKTLPHRPGHVAPRGACSCRCANAVILNATS